MSHPLGKHVHQCPDCGIRWFCRDIQQWWFSSNGRFILGPICLTFTGLCDECEADPAPYTGITEEPDGMHPEGPLLLR